MFSRDEITTLAESPAGRVMQSKFKELSDIALQEARRLTNQQLATTNY